MLSALRGLHKPNPQHTHTVHDISVVIQRNARTLELTLRRDSALPQQYWVFCECGRCYLDQAEIGRIETSRSIENKHHRKASDPPLLAGHHKHPVPAMSRLLEQILLAPLPVGPRRPILGPPRQNLQTHAAPVPNAGGNTSLRACANRSSRSCNSAPVPLAAISASPPDQLIDRHRLQLALHADQIQFAKHETAILRRLVASSR